MAERSNFRLPGSLKTTPGKAGRQPERTAPRAVRCLLETFSVLTRLAAPFRVAPHIARAAVEAALPEDTLFVAIVPEDCFAAMRVVESQSLAGGKVYDAAIVHCASRAGATVLLSFDAKDHLRIAPPHLEVVVPGDL